MSPGLGAVREGQRVSAYGGRGTAESGLTRVPPAHPWPRCQWGEAEQLGSGTRRGRSGTERGGSNVEVMGRGRWVANPPAAFPPPPRSTHGIGYGGCAVRGGSGPSARLWGWGS